VRIAIESGATSASRRFRSRRLPRCAARHGSGVLSLVLMWLAAWPATAFAHVRGGEAVGFTSGVLHPVSGLDHVLAMIAVGLWGAQLGAPAVWLLPVTFPMVMAFGGMLGLMGVAIPGIEVGIALSAIGLGIAVCCEAQPKLWVAALLVGVFAIFHGHAHGTELPPGANGLLYSIGFVMATGLLHGTGIGIGLVHRWRWSPWLACRSSGEPSHSGERCEEP
jgi:urease accessory protein